MADRRAISASLRWQVFARDGFRCRYCGRQAGEPGVILHADHVISVADGGTNAYDNLVAACQRCNGGKSARSLDVAPGSPQAIAFAARNAATLRQQAEAMAERIEARKELEQSVVDVICDAYDRDGFYLSPKDLGRFADLVTIHGPEAIADWVGQAATRRIRLDQLLRYVHGIIRKIREESGASK